MAAAPHVCLYVQASPRGGGSGRPGQETRSASRPKFASWGGPSTTQQVRQLGHWTYVVLGYVSASCPPPSVQLLCSGDTCLPPVRPSLQA